MVSLVKARKKAKEKKEQEQHPATTAADQPAPAASTPPAPSSEPDAGPTRGAEAPAPDSTPPPVATTPAHEKLEAFKRTANELRVEVAELDQQREVVVDTILELLLFAIAGEQYALPIERIIEIISPRPATRVPNADPTVLGIISLRGTIVSILDIRRKLGHQPVSAAGPDSRIIVVENDGETAGFLVDRVQRVVRIEPSQVGSHPVVTASEQSEYIRGVFQHAQKLSILLDLERLLRF